jgi:hypothetical protein
MTPKATKDNVDTKQSADGPHLMVRAVVEAFNCADHSSSQSGSWEVWNEG